MADTPALVFENEPIPSYTTEDRPDASTVTVGFQIYNLDDNAPNYSDGTDWRDAEGNIT